MDRFIIVAFVATFLAAVAAVVGVPVLAQEAPPPPMAPAPGDAAQTTPRDRFAAMDTDHDGRISKAEWLAAGRKERGFAMMDGDHDGYVTIAEMKAGRAKMRAMRDAKGNE